MKATDWHFRVFSERNSSVTVIGFRSLLFSCFKRFFVAGSLCAETDRNSCDGRFCSKKRKFVCSFFFFFFLPFLCVVIYLPALPLTAGVGGPFLAILHSAKVYYLKKYFHLGAKCVPAAATSRLRVPSLITRL